MINEEKRDSTHHPIAKSSSTMALATTRRTSAVGVDGLTLELTPKRYLIEDTTRNNREEQESASK